MNLSVARYSHRGGRSTNEDYIGFCANDAIGCFVLADGTGGYEGGALASEAVVKHILEVFSARPSVTLEMIRESIQLAKEALHLVRSQHPEFVHMNTTLATLMLDVNSTKALWCHLGDSRIYLFRNGRARLLTRDHSILQSMIDAGFAQGASRGNIERNTLYASVGSVEVPEHAVCGDSLTVQSGDAFLLCSDGFWERLDESIMELALRSAVTSEQWIQRMVAQIPDPEAAEQDNFSALTVWVGDQEEVTRIQSLQEHQAA